jgi:hypothetical protein
MKKLLAYILLTFMCQAGYAQSDLVNYVERGICHVISKDFKGSASHGSGWFYKELPNEYVLCTNGHVLDGGSQFTVKLYEDGYFSNEIPARKIVSFYVKGTDVDFGFLAVNKKYFTEPPTLFKISENVSVQSKEMLVGWGIPRGDFAMFWKTRVVKDEGDTIEVNFPFISGMSGGPVINPENREVIGMVTWRYTDKNTGGAISSNKFNKIAGPAKHVKIKANFIERDRVEVSKKETSENEVCNVCGHKRKDHYLTINPKTGKLDSDSLYCPKIGDLQEVQCGPNGCYPDYYYSRGRPYYRSGGGGIYFGIGGGRQVIPNPNYQQPYVAPQPAPQPVQPTRPVQPAQPIAPEEIWPDRDFGSDKSDEKQKMIDELQKRLEELEKAEQEKEKEKAEPKEEPKEEPKQEQPEQPFIPVIPTEDFSLDKEESSLKDIDWKGWAYNAAIAGAGAALGGITLPGILAKYFGFGPWMSYLIGGVIKRRVKRRFVKTPDGYDDEEEVVEEDIIDTDFNAQKKKW